MGERWRTNIETVSYLDHIYLPDIQRTPQEYLSIHGKDRAAFIAGKGRASKGPEKGVCGCASGGVNAEKVGAVRLVIVDSA